MSTDSTGYPARQAIRRQAFAVRHMLLEEIKHRRFLLRAAPDPVLDRRLVALARGLQVEQPTGGGFMVSVAGHGVVRVEPDGLRLYVRGDTPAHVAEQAARQAHAAAVPDEWLEHNRREVARILDALLDYIAARD